MKEGGHFRAIDSGVKIVVDGHGAGEAVGRTLLWSDIPPSILSSLLFIFLILGDHDVFRHRKHGKHL